MKKFQMNVTTFLTLFVRRTESTIENGLLIWGYRPIVPSSMKNMLLKEIHPCHMGILEMKSLARICLWWPMLDTDLYDK